MTRESIATQRYLRVANALKLVDLGEPLSPAQRKTLRKVLEAEAKRPLRGHNGKPKPGSLFADRADEGEPHAE